MVNKKLVDYIERQFKNGKTEAMTRRNLLKNGWKTEDIEKGIIEAKNLMYSDYMDPLPERKKKRKFRRKHIKGKKPKKKSSLKLLIILIPVIIILILMLLFVFGFI